MDQSDRYTVCVSVWMHCTWHQTTKIIYCSWKKALGHLHPPPPHPFLFFSKQKMWIRMTSSCVEARLTAASGRFGSRGGKLSVSHTYEARGAREVLSLSTPAEKSRAHHICADGASLFIVFLWKSRRNSVITSIWTVKGCVRTNCLSLTSKLIVWLKMYSVADVMQQSCQTVDGYVKYQKSATQLLFVLAVFPPFSCYTILSSSFFSSLAAEISVQVFNFIVPSANAVFHVSIWILILFVSL